MTDEEKQVYGNRCPKGYKKLNMLGRGGYALVWLAVEERSNKQVAIK